MKNTCTQWKDQLLEAALTETEGRELRAHLAQCTECAAALKRLQVRRQRMDALLPQLARAEEPSPDLRVRIMAQVELQKSQRRSRFGIRWAVAGIAAVVAITVAVGLVWKSSAARQDAEIRTAQALAQWQAPTDVFLQTPGHEFLSSIPRLGESYIQISIAAEKGGSK